MEFRPGNRVQLAVSDDGIARENQELFIEPFSRQKHWGKKPASASLLYWKSSNRRCLRRRFRLDYTDQGMKGAAQGFRSTAGTICPSVTTPFCRHRTYAAANRSNSLRVSNHYCRVTSGSVSASHAAAREDLIVTVATFRFSFAYHPGRRAEEGAPEGQRNHHAGRDGSERKKPLPDFVIGYIRIKFFHFYLMPLLHQS